MVTDIEAGRHGVKFMFGKAFSARFLILRYILRQVQAHVILGYRGSRGAGLHGWRLPEGIEMEPVRARGPAPLP